ncbi:MAG: rhombosortase [Alteromonadaceae bacterium]|nr:rhombosortase [Alteromonadaceae bacterium]
MGVSKLSTIRSNSLTILQNFSLPLARTQWTGPFCLLLCAFVLELSPLFTYEHLAYHRDSIATGEVYRLISGHLLHTNFIHLLLNTGGVLLLWLLHGDFYRTTSYLAQFLFFALLCSAGLWFFSTDMQWYVGLSGAIHGMFVFGAVDDIKRKISSGWILLLGVVIKIVLEQTQGASESVAVLIDANVAVDSHLYGAIAGLMLAVGYLVVEKAKTPPPLS